ncbi:uncharacterized protein TA20215 [Theileria annulata]|uniref:Uncharacterized protein n=1 Tax=Theileria annulata TaxID=5874 RepID=Q4UHB4_THEAN|nr:uncharacterized protein TA20215 [Theileria annulata]CAI73525.1 hypothetical protein TA20215 [Theileria annulata]|eukprot:XP_954202.1 hypothetical protein TA20215 [Theileria annulata]
MAKKFTSMNKIHALLFFVLATVQVKGFGLHKFIPGSLLENPIDPEVRCGPWGYWTPCNHNNNKSRVRACRYRRGEAPHYPNRGDLSESEWQIYEQYFRIFGQKDTEEYVHMPDIQSVSCQYGENVTPSQGGGNNSGEIPRLKIDFTTFDQDQSESQKNFHNGRHDSSDNFKIEHEVQEIDRIKEVDSHKSPNKSVRLPDDPPVDSADVNLSPNKQETEKQRDLKRQGKGRKKEGKGRKREGKGRKREGKVRKRRSKDRKNEEGGISAEEREQRRQRREERERKKQERLRKQEEERLEQERLEKERLAEQERLDIEEKIRFAQEVQKRLAREETERLKKERLEQERLEKERLEKERLRKLEEERLEKERLEQERLEQAGIEEEQKRLEQERLAIEEQEKLEKERIRKEEERLEQERLEKERLAEQERLDIEEKIRFAQEVQKRLAREETERLKKERLEQERLEKERLEKERLEQQRQEQERLRKLEERLEQERLAIEEQERLEKERIEQERIRKLEEQRLEKERLAEKERLDIEEKIRFAQEVQKRLAREETERLKKERLEQERLEKERLEKERLEQQRQEQERLRKLEERLEKERIHEEQERLEKERIEQERIRKLEEQRLEKERLAEKERLDIEEKIRFAQEVQKRLAREETERLKKERLEQERLEKERLEKERLEQQRQEQERLRKLEERLEKERIHEEQERLEKERIEQERIRKLEEQRLEKERLAEKERLDIEEKIRFAQEVQKRLAREETERLKKERLEQERLEKERLEKERLRKQEEERLEKERLSGINVGNKRSGDYDIPAFVPSISADEFSVDGEEEDDDYEDELPLIPASIDRIKSGISQSDVEIKPPFSGHNFPEGGLSPINPSESSTEFEIPAEHSVSVSDYQKSMNKSDFPDSKLNLPDSRSDLKVPDSPTHPTTGNNVGENDVKDMKSEELSGSFKEPESKHIKSTTRLSEVSKVSNVLPIEKHEPESEDKISNDTMKEVGTGVDLGSKSHSDTDEHKLPEEEETATNDTDEHKLPEEEETATNDTEDEGSEKRIGELESKESSSQIYPHEVATHTPEPKSIKQEHFEDEESIDDESDVSSEHDDEETNYNNPKPEREPEPEPNPELEREEEFDNMKKDEESEGKFSRGAKIAGGVIGALIAIGAAGTGYHFKTKGRVEGGEIDEIDFDYTEAGDSDEVETAVLITEDVWENEV